MRRFLIFVSLMLTTVLTAGVFGCGGNKRGGDAKPTISFTEQSITIDEWTQMRVDVTVSDGKGYDLSVDDSEVIYIRGANITGLKKGTAVLTAKAKSDPTVSATVTVTVNEKASNRPEFKLEGEKELGVLDKATYKATLTNAQDYVVKYGVSDNTKATIDENSGALEAIATGDIKVNATVTYRSKVFNAEIDVKIIQAPRAVFDTEASSAKLHVVNDIKSDLTGEYTIKIKDTPYTVDGEGNITLNGADFLENIGSFVDGVIEQDAGNYNFKIKIIFNAIGNIYQNGVALVKDADGYKVDKTQAADDKGLRWVTFDDAQEKIDNGYKFMRITIKFSDFCQLGAGLIHNNVTGGGEPYFYNFGFKTKDAWVFYQNEYINTEGNQGGFAGAMDPSTGCATANSYFNIYNADGTKKLLDCFNKSGWSSYVKPNLSLDTEYVLEFGLEGCGDISLSGIDDAVITKIEYAKTMLKN